MSYLRRFSSVLLTGAILAVSGCDTPTPTDPQSPASEVEQLGLLGTVTGLLSPEREVNVLERAEPLESELSATRVIGRDGGVIRIPEAGLTVSIPRHALTQSTRITVTAPAGDLVGYHFAPHGLRFRRSVTVRQDLSMTEAGLVTTLLGGLSGAYFVGDLQPKLLALEILDLSILDGLLAQFSIDHFSGYVIATD